MSLDTMIVNAGRLRILAVLAGAGAQEFVSLRQSTQLTDGNLASHARRLQSAGLIAVDKQFRAGKPVTRFTLTAEGRAALESHVRQLAKAIGLYPERPAPAMTIAAETDDWVD